MHTSACYGSTESNCSRPTVATSLPFCVFFYREYDEKLYYWVSELRATGRLYFDTNRLLDAEQEAVECIRKSLLMGFASFFQVGGGKTLGAVVG
jgi:hypothetical protein